ncbi:hypothetical protein MKEN_00245700 [Mycena kentingensis (nom. inval.)]|nr:hypothetical protein MKEN_00245700 [Mycena kentingensis (nom. inval.)]
MYLYTIPVTFCALFASALSAEQHLLDIVLIASVEGKLHALNRTTGHSVWIMSSSIEPLVNSSYSGDAGQEKYIIEPQSGDIYVMATPASPLQRFPFSMPELVDMSPFSFAAEEDRRVFLGKKQVPLFVLELETGRLKETAAGNASEEWHDGEELDFHELDDLKEDPTEVYIGRTDYHVAIHTRGQQRVPVQTLSFSAYGPITRDNVLQAAYRRTLDDTYIQSLPSGEIISFTARETARTNSVLWASKFTNPVVAAFDVLQVEKPRKRTFALLQPRPLMSAILPQLKKITSVDELPHLDSAYVGLVQETGNLFAMSPERFPLVGLSDGGSLDQRRLPGADALRRGSKPPKIVEKQEDRERALREKDYGADDERCMEWSAPYTDRCCLVGIRLLEGDDVEMRMKRLIDGVPPVPWDTKEKPSQKGLANALGIAPEGVSAIQRIVLEGCILRVRHGRKHGGLLCGMDTISEQLRRSR